jgi:hypothetical protein
VSPARCTRLTLLAGMPDIMLPTQRLQLLTMVCTHGAKFDRLQVRRRVSALFSSLATFYDSYTHPRVSDADLGAAIEGGRRALALPHAGVGRADDVRAAAIASEQSARVVAHFASRSAAAAARDRAVGDRVAAAALQATFDDRRRACVAQRR